jgi:uncharacterized protein involved in response to NO
MLFSAGFLQALCATGWWLMVLLLRSHADNSAGWWGISWAHPVMMAYGIFPPFIFGFLLTTFPAWLNEPAIEPVRALPVALLISFGGLLCYGGMAAAGWVLLVGLVLMLAGWLLAAGLLWQVLFHTRRAVGPVDRRHAWAAGAGILGGAGGLLSVVLWMLTQHPFWLELARVAGVWFFLLPVFMTVSHRMIPFFSSRVLKDYVVVRPYALLWVMLAGSIGHGLLTLWHVTPLIGDAPLFACAVYLSWQWRWWRSFSVSLLAVLHMGFLWLVCGMALFVWQDIGRWFTWPNIGLAPLHALTLGFFFSMLMGMVSRVSLGHSGRPLHLARTDYVLFWMMQAVALTRVLADCLPVGVARQDLYGLAAGVWLLVLVVWTMRFMPMYWRVRVDGKPG